MTYSNDPNRGSNSDATDDGGEYVASPCIGLCELCPTSGYCKGCLRTGPEIGTWPHLSSAGKRGLLAAIERRENDPATRELIREWEREARG